LNIRARAPGVEYKTREDLPPDFPGSAAVSVIAKRPLCTVLVCAALVLAGCAPELDWRELSVPEGGFAVLLPGKARAEARTLDTTAGALTMTMYAVSLKQGTMAVAYTDYPAAALAGEHGREQLNAERDALLRNIGAAAHSEEEIVIGGLPGRQVYAEGRTGARGVLLKARFVVVGNRLYQIAYVGEHGGLATADIDMFLTSFKLLR
jgi:hypothetical protein